VRKVLPIERKENKNAMINLACISTSPHRLRQIISPATRTWHQGAALKVDRGPLSLLADGFHELVKAAPGGEALTFAFALSLAALASGDSGKGLCFCSAAGDTREHGALYGHGLAALGIEPERMLMITAAKEKDLLWTLEEAVTSGAFGAVVGSLGDKEWLYGFAASRRLKLRAAASQTPLFLLRHRSNGGATAAQGRWTVLVLPSRYEGEHAGYALLGPPRLRLTLERMGGLPPQSWEMGFNGTGDFDMDALLEDRPARKVGKRWDRAA
jgi:protein ImuA